MSTRREVLEAKMLIAATPHENESVWQRRVARLPLLLEAWTRELGHTECKLCHQRDVEVIGEGLCIMCVKEIKADGQDWAAIYTQR